MSASDEKQRLLKLRQLEDQVLSQQREEARTLGCIDALESSISQQEQLLRRLQSELRAKEQWLRDLRDRMSPTENALAILRREWEL